MRVIVIVALAACVGSKSVPCPDGANCPEGTVCATVTNVRGASVNYCVFEDQLGCEGSGACTASRVSDGGCHDGVCLPVVCGNELVDPAEVCDDGNTVSADGCSKDCISDETCGNNVTDLEMREECDDGVAGKSYDGCSSTCRREVLSWREIPPVALSARAGAAMVFDRARKVVVLFGGGGRSDLLGDTWEWDGVQWNIRFPARAPSARTGHVMAYDNARHRVVLFGGFDDTATFRDDTWEWDGVTWVEIQPATRPPVRYSPAMTFDSGRNRVVMFGGFAGTDNLDDTWEWDGTSWIQTTSAMTPPGGVLVSMGYLSETSTVVLYTQTETWVRNGTQWSRVTPVTPPTIFFPASQMIYDAGTQRLVLAGRTSAGVLELWAWSGTDWQEINFTGGPPKREQFAFAHFEGASTSLLLFGGLDYPVNQLFGDTWSYISFWGQMPGASPGPTARGAHTLAYHARRGSVALFGGAANNCAAFFDSLWLLDETGWTRVASASAPPLARAYQGMVYDSARDKLVLFGGGTRGCDSLEFMTTYSDTWEVDAQMEWALAQPVRSPPSRSAHAMVFDERAGVTVVFGGISCINQNCSDVGDTWTWDGTTWTDVTPAVSPSPRRRASIAYDPVRERVVLFGGKSGPAFSSTILGDTWEWDGATWTKRLDTSPLSTRFAAGMTYDADRQRVVLNGGIGAGVTTEVWEWDGATWTQREIEVDAGFREGIVHDRRQHRIVAFGGYGAALTQDDTWSLEYRSPGEKAERCLAADANEDGDALAGCADPDCWGRCSPLCPPATSCPASAPRCGDGNCSSIEDRSICPQDCP